MKLFKAKLEILDPSESKSKVEQLLDEKIEEIAKVFHKKTVHFN